MDAKERLLLRQKLEEYAEQKRGDRSQLPRLDPKTEPHKVEVVRQVIAELKAKDRQEWLALHPQATNIVGEAIASANQKAAEPPATEQPVDPAAEKIKAEPQPAEAAVAATVKPPTPAQAVPEVVTPPVAPVANEPAVLTPVGRDTGSVLKPKQQRLADLLELYKANRMTPKEYYERRAIILAEP
jgi:hypothetical protein